MDGYSDYKSTTKSYPPKTIVGNEEIKHELQMQIDISEALGANFVDAFIVNSAAKTSTLVKRAGHILPPEQRKEFSDYDKVWSSYVDRFVDESDKQRVLESVALDVVLQGIRDKGEHSVIYHTSNPEGEGGNYYQAVFRDIFLSELDYHAILLAFRSVDDIMAERREHEKALVEALKAAEQGNRSKSTFLTSMSHDLRTPMNAIIGFASLVADHINEPEVISDYIEKIQSSSQLLLGLIDDILDMSRIESGSIALNEAPFSLRKLIKEIETMVRASVDQKNLELVISADDIRNDDVITDRARLSRVIINLVSNAIKFTMPGGTIEVRLEQVEDEIEGFGSYMLVVEDNGIGMDPEFVKRAFEPFEREKTATVTGIQGAGLGLTIARSIVDMIGGTIEVESNLGEGSRFTVRMKLRLVIKQDEEKKPHRVKLDEDNLPDFHGRNVLLVEDNHLNSEIATMLLERVGFEVEPVYDGTEAVERVEEEGANAFDLVLMDIQMPQMDGYDATRHIREMQGADINELPIVALTANVFEEDRRRAFDAGMNAHVPKPVNVEQLMGVIEDLLEKDKGE